MLDLFNREIVGFSAGPNKEFIYQETFDSIDHLKMELFDYVNWYNNHRLHSSLGYMTPADYKYLHLKKIV